MKQLKLEYVDSLPEKGKRLVLFFQKNQLAELESEFHKMKGTGKTYGLPEVSLLAEILEKICMDHSEFLHSAIPVALHLIEEIYKTRKADLAFMIEEIDEFQKLKLITRNKT